MKLKQLHIILVLITMMIVSCFDPSKPNYQYFPNMYESVGYKTYQESDAFPNGIQAQEPVEKSIPRGWQPYEYEDSNDGYENAKLYLKSPLDINEQNMSVGKELYEIYCSVCHGSKGAGQGILVKREKILGIPSYADQGRAITSGSTYHVIYYGKNTMGSYANQLNEKERWMVTSYVMKLKSDLSK